MDLTIGANPFFWQADAWRGFYDDMAQAPVERVVLGEWVCSKRLPFYQDRIPGAIEALLEAGKEVAVTSLALITLKRERRLSRDLVEAGVAIEVNDLTQLAYLPAGAEFWVGPLVNTYNEGTLAWLAGRGASRICLPPELPLTSVTALAAEGAKRGVAVEVWGHGRLPLAMSGRCYHARLHKRSKDNCQFACEQDPDGLRVDTLDGQPFLAMNGVQTLSNSCASMAHQLEVLQQAGVTALRLSPQSGDFAALCRDWRARIDGGLDGAALAARLAARHQDMQLSDGFLTGARGADWSAATARQQA